MNRPRKILTLPDPRLAMKSSPVSGITSRALAVAADLVATMKVYPHSVGIAAPQIGEMTRVIVTDARKAKRPCENSGRLILFNPEIISSSGKTVFREGCMSVPGFGGFVERAAVIEIAALDESGARRLVRSRGFEAVILQHEIDHLDGILFINRMKPIDRASSGRI